MDYKFCPAYRKKLNRSNQLLSRGPNIRRPAFPVRICHCPLMGRLGPGLSGWGFSRGLQRQRMPAQEEMSRSLQPRRLENRVPKMRCPATHQCLRVAERGQPLCRSLPLLCPLICWRCWSICHLDLRGNLRRCLSRGERRASSLTSLAKVGFVDCAVLTRD